MGMPIWETGGVALEYAPPQAPTSSSMLPQHGSATQHQLSSSINHAGGGAGGVGHSAFHHAPSGPSSVRNESLSLQFSVPPAYVPMCLSPPMRRLLGRRIAEVTIEVARLCIALNLEIRSNVKSNEDPLGLLWLSLPHCRSPVDSLLQPGEVIKPFSQRASPHVSPAGSPRSRPVASFQPPAVLTPSASHGLLNFAGDDSREEVGVLSDEEDEDELGAVAVMSFHSGIDTHLI